MFVSNTLNDLIQLIFIIDLGVMNITQTTNSFVLILNSVVYLAQELSCVRVSRTYGNAYILPFTETFSLGMQIVYTVVGPF